MNFADDIPRDLARAAHAGTSFVPEDRAEQERASYAAELTRDYEALAALAAKAPDADAARERLDAEFPRYRAGYRRRYTLMLERRSRCMSSMITGPSNFPTRRNEKANAAADRAVEDLLTFRKRALAAINKAIRPDLAPIMAGDSDAVVRLRAEIAKLEEKQERMKATNAAIRKHAKAGEAAQVAALVALGHAESVARELIKPDYCGRIGYADYETKNNGANIRRLQGRLAGIERSKATTETSTEGVGGVRVEDSPGDNRVRIFFPGKPDASVREALKAHGFRWAPTLGCWQAYRNHNSLTHAQTFTKEV